MILWIMIKQLLLNVNSSSEISINSENMFRNAYHTCFCKEQQLCKF